MINNPINLAGNIGLQSLLQEPERLVKEAERINVELESLVLENYRVFIDNLTCNLHLQAEEKKLDNISEGLNNNAQSLLKECASFKERVQQFVNFHKRNRKTLHHHMQLIELLEVPQLVNGCTRTGFYDEAIELANFVNGLERRHLLATEVKQQENNQDSALSTNNTSGGQGVIQSIVNEVHRILDTLRQQLLIQLTENNSLPKQMQILATLRKMDGLFIDRMLALNKQQGSVQLREQYLQAAELKHQMDFLEARTVWMHKQYQHNNITSANTTITTKVGSDALGPYGKAMEILETRRAAYYAIITQFHALFKEYRLSSTSTTTTTTNSINNNDNINNTMLSSTSTILHSWTCQHIQQLLHSLHTLLLQIDDGASVRSVLEQAVYFTQRLAQVGADFTSSVLAVFERVLLTKVQRDVTTLLEHFEVILLHERITFDQTDHAREQIIPLYLAQDTNTTTTDNSNTNTNTTSNHNNIQEIDAPTVVLKFPPLVYLLNGYLSLLNYLKECPLVTIYTDLLQLLTQSFQKVIQLLIMQNTHIRMIGEKYLDALLNNTMNNNNNNLSRSKSSNIYTSSTSNTTTTITAGVGVGGQKKEYLDILYAQSMAMDIIPHVLLCFEAIFDLSFKQSVPQKLQSKVKPTTNNNLVTAMKPVVKHVVNSYGECKELIGSYLTQHIVVHCWELFVQGQLLDGKVLQLPAHTVSATATATVVASSSKPVISAATNVVNNTANANNTISDVGIDMKDIVSLLPDAVTTDTIDESTVVVADDSVQDGTEDVVQDISDIIESDAGSSELK